MLPIKRRFNLCVVFPNIYIVLEAENLFTFQFKNKIVKYQLHNLIFQIYTLNKKTFEPLFLKG